MPPILNAVVKVIVQKLQQELKTAQNASQDAHNNATHSETVAENKYDTLALEAAYLAHGQSLRIEELQIAIAEYQSMPLPAQKNSVQLGSLVEFEYANGSQHRVFIGPRNGGLKFHDNNGEILLITLAAPLAKVILGRQCGDEVALQTATKNQQILITGIR